MGDRRSQSPTRDVLFGFVLGTGGVLITLAASSRYELGYAAKLFVFWGSTVALLLLYFAYLFVAGVIRAQCASRGQETSSDATETGHASYVQWVRAFILLVSLGVAALFAYTLRQIYSFGFVTSILIGMGSFVILNGALTTVENVLTRLVGSRRGT